MFHQFNVPGLDTTAISIEEIATTMVELAGLKRAS
jgi:regulator of PEP synthase PpsR (kinase-PPPase family)